MDQLDEFDIRQYLDALRRRLWVIILSVAVCAVVAATVSLMQPRIYESTAKVLISAQQDTSGTGTALSDPNQLQNQMQTQVQIAESPAVKADADRSLGADSEKVIAVRASGVTNTRVMEITASSEDPAVAQRAADAYSRVYLAAGANTAIDRLAAIGDAVNQKKAQLQTQVNSLTQQLNATPKPTGAALDALNSQIDTLNAQIAQIQRQYDNSQATALVREASAQPFADAEIAEEPVSPKPLRNTALAIVLGLLIGIGIALIWERLDDRLRTNDQLTRWFPKLGQVGTIPRIADWKNEAEAKNIVLAEPHSTTAEAYRALRTSIEFMSIDQDLQVIEVTSSTPGEGKSTTVANLATAMAWGGKNVVIVSADLRRPRVHEFFGVPTSRGLTTLMLNRAASVEDVLQEANIGTHEGWVKVLSTGILPPNPSELLGTTAMEDIVKQLRKIADYVIIDAPPVLPVADPLVLSSYADGVLLVAGAMEVRKGELQRAVAIMEHSLRCPIIGVVLNNSEEAAGYQKQYGEYASTPASAPVDFSAPVTHAPSTVAAQTHVHSEQLDEVAMTAEAPHDAHNEHAINLNEGVAEDKPKGKRHLAPKKPGTKVILPLRKSNEQHD